MKSITELRDIIEYQLENLTLPNVPKNLYDPIKYVLSIGGKRTRPALTLIAHQLFNNELKKSYMPALAIELFHNFTLIHDDIMDRAIIRRNKKTVHEKWDNNIAILAGDAMLIQAYKLLSHSEEAVLKDLILTFNDTAIKVCEGQQLDMDFQFRHDVTVVDYLTMIECKTAYLLASALVIGGITAFASIEERRLLFDFGINIGIAFQLKDDLLDVFGKTDTFGKEIGGDIRMNKKTILYLQALELANRDQKEKLEYYFSHSEDINKKVEEVKKIFTDLSIPFFVKEKMKEYHEKAIQSLNLIKSENKDPLFLFTEQLFDRST